MRCPAIAGGGRGLVRTGAAGRDRWRLDHRSQHLGQALGQHVVGRTRPRPARRAAAPIAARAVGVVEQAGQRRRHRRRRRRARPRRRPSRRRPRPRPRPRWRRPTWGTPHAAASRNTMPKPSCSSPAQRLRHSMAKTSAQPYRAGRSSSGTRPSNRTGARSRPTSRSSRAPVPARPRRWRPPGRVAPGASRAAASISTSIPLRGTSRLRLDAPPARRPAGRTAPAALARSLGVERPEPLGSTPGGTLRHRQRPPGGPLGLGRRVAAGGDDLGAPRSTWPSSARPPGSRPGTVTSAPCSTTP